MQLKSIRYSEFQGLDNEWVLDELTLGSSNLIVGKNSSGKTRCLNLIAGLAQMLAGKIPVVSNGRYDVLFEMASNEVSYALDIRNGSVQFEEFKINGDVLLTRASDGKGHIRADAIDKVTLIQFQISTTQLAAIAKRDQIQHPFLMPLEQWSSSLRYYSFNTSLGHHSMAFLVKDAPRVDDYDQNQTIGAFRAGMREFRDAFKERIIADMQRVDYFIEDIGTRSPSTIQLLTPAPGESAVLFVKEKDVKAPIEQFQLSTGMFRVLAILIHINYCQLKQNAECILVDDVGEGLDFERSLKLIKLLREKTANSKLQLVLATNDRFVMNSVPLDEWTVLQRRGSNVTVRNNKNSHEVFDDFKFTGLSNFSFFEMDVLNKIEST